MKTLAAKENRMKKIESLPEELLSLIRHGEDYQIEYKEAYQELPKSLFDTVSSFSNREGGDIFLGVHVFEIIIPLTTGSMTKVGPGTDGASGEVSGEVSTQAEYASSTQAEYASSTQAVTISLDVNKLNDLLDYCSEPRTRAEMQEYCGIKTREYFRKKILVPMIQSGKLLLTIPDRPNSPNQKYRKA